MPTKREFFMFILLVVVVIGLMLGAHALDIAKGASQNASQTSIGTGTNPINPVDPLSPAGQLNKGNPLSPFK